MGTKISGNKGVSQENLHEETTGSQLKDNSLNQKLNILLDLGKGLDAKIQDQDVRLQKHEERVSREFKIQVHVATCTAKRTYDVIFGVFIKLRTSSYKFTT